jgi:tRNA pseudouridine32 synthase/23S rRNA pseudouridine746 synthase
MDNDPCFHLFSNQAPEEERPQRFTFPFFYTPHSWSIRAAELLIERLQTESFNHDFGLQPDATDDACGKMFGVLLVENKVGQIGYLAAFSGKMGNSNHHEGFVPPLFDMLDPKGHYRLTEAELSAMNRAIERLENDAIFLALEKEIEQISSLADASRKAAKEDYQRGKLQRAHIRNTLTALPAEEAIKTAEMLNNQSRAQQLAYKQTTKIWNARIEALKNQRKTFIHPIEELKIERRKKSAALQNWLFDQYQFLNSGQATKALSAIFAPNEPPSGAGECAAPKLLQYAFGKGYKPICMAEFWWGKSPQTEIRTHRIFYPACRGKCLPILSYMLEGIETDPNPLLDARFDSLQIEIIGEDEALIIIHKPSGLLSVPGKTKQDSVYAQIKRLRPEAKGPLIVHRLDRSTSGIMLIPKTEQAYAHLQQQFIDRSIEKRYVALLEGEIAGQTGEIRLPLRPDIDDRPRQLVCFEHGREAITYWEKIEVNNGMSRIHFYPKTGRTHQLRVHAAHTLGLNAAIDGDELYGKAGERLKLHAESIKFMHPSTGKRVNYVCQPEF